MDVELKLKKFSENDFQSYFELVSDERVMAMITERPLGLEEATRDFEKLIENNNLDLNFGSYKISNAETGEFLGFAKLEIEHKKGSEAEIGYMILPKHWGKGIPGKITRQLIEKAKVQKSIKGLFAIIDPKNLASRKILTNNRFVSREFRDFEGLAGEVLELKLITR